MGLSPRRLEYWARTGLVPPSVRTSGGHRRYAFSDLVALRTIKRLTDAGISVQRIRKSVQKLTQILPAVGRPLSELVLVASGDAVVVLRRGAAFEAVSGQAWILEIAAFQREIEDRMNALGAPPTRVSSRDAADRASGSA